MDQKPKTSRLYQFRLVFIVLAASVLLGLIRWLGNPDDSAAEIAFWVLECWLILFATGWAINELVRGMEEGGES